MDKIFPQHQWRGHSVFQALDKIFNNEDVLHHFGNVCSELSVLQAMSGVSEDAVSAAIIAFTMFFSPVVNSVAEEEILFNVFRDSLRDAKEVTDLVRATPHSTTMQ